MKILRWLPPLIAAVFSIIPMSHGVEFQSPRTLGLGGAGRGGPWLTDSIYLNPSFASYTPVYVLSGTYTGSNHGRNYNLSVQDSRTETFQAGAGFTKRDQNNVVNIGASKAFMKTLGVGVGSKFIFDPGSGNPTPDFTVSTSYLATEWMYAAIIIDNLIAGTDQTARNLHRTAYAGLKFIPTKKVGIFIDPFYSPAYSLGPKGGYHAGIGGAWVGPKLSLEYAMSRALSTHSGLGFTTAQSGSVMIFF
ncbi:MAG: hypothetical protein EBX52_07640 [Proteobacteria bacterium]|nr:hypothetical protein [Pseudomonadota bacterium]